MRNQQKEKLNLQINDGANVNNIDNGVTGESQYMQSKYLKPVNQYEEYVKAQENFTQKFKLQKTANITTTNSNFSKTQPLANLTSTPVNNNTTTTTQPFSNLAQTI